jgi:hypothetical protein
MSMIESVRTYIKDYTALGDNAPVWVAYLGVSAGQYDVLPVAGGKVIETYINDTRLCEYPFAFRGMESTADELARLENYGLFEAFSEWLDQQTMADDLPTLDGGKTAEAIEATGWGYLFQEGQSATGVYQILCRLIYKENLNYDDSES